MAGAYLFLVCRVRGLRVKYLFVVALLVAALLVSSLLTLMSVAFLGGLL